MPDDPTFENQPAAPGTDDVTAADLSHPDDAAAADAEGGAPTTVDEAKQSDTDVAYDWDKDSVDPKSPDPQAEAWANNPVVQTYDKSVGLNEDSDQVATAPDHGNVVHQSGLPDQRTDDGVEYPEAEPYVSAQHTLNQEVAPVVPVAPGDGPDEGSVLRPAPEGPSVVEGKKDTVPNPDGQPMSLQEQIDRGIGTPSPNVATPSYEDETETETGRDLTPIEQELAEGTNNPQHGPVAPDDAAGATEGPRDANPTKYEPN